MSIKLIRVLTRFGAGGPPIHCLVATRELAKIGYQTSLVAGQCGPGDGDMSYLVREDDPVRALPTLTPLSSLIGDARSVVSLWRLFRKERPEIVHTHTARAGAVGRVAAMLAGVPVIVHTYHGHVMRGYFPAWKSRLFVWIERLLGRCSDAICVLSGRQAHELAHDIVVAPEEKIRVVPLGMELSALQALPDADGPVHVGWLGRMVPIKDVPLLVEVVNRVLQSGANVRFLIAGDGTERPTLERAMSRWGNQVEYVGWVQDVAPVIARCHFLLQTSRSEGTPVALIQGMAARRPFVATAVGGVPDMAAGERHGLLCAPNADDLAGAVQRLAADAPLRKQMGVAAARFAAEHYSSDRLVADLDALYRELLGRSR